MRANNPTLKEATFDQFRDRDDSGPAMTLRGFYGKTAILFAIMLSTAAVGWQLANSAVLIVSALVALGLAIFMGFKKQMSGTLAPVYAGFEGLFVGSLSVFFATVYGDTKYGPIVPVAVIATLGVFGIMLALYSSGIIKVTETFKMVVIGATAAIAITYVGSWIASMFWPGVWNLPMYSSGPMGIVFSVGVIIVAALNLALDFQLVKDGVESGAPKYMEWYCGFALLVTVVWLYIEILRLLAKLSGRRD